MYFDHQPTLCCELLTLRPLRREDHDALFAAASDPLIWELHPARDRYKPEVFEPYFEDALKAGALAAIDNSTGELIGTSRFHGHGEAKREIEIGWTFLIRRCWGGAFNREMKHLMLAYAFQYVDSVIFVIGPNNFRSQKSDHKHRCNRGSAAPRRIAGLSPQQAVMAGTLNLSFHVSLRSHRHW